MQKLQRAGIVSKVIISDSSMFSHIYYAHALQERHQGTDDDQNIYCLAQVTKRPCVRFERVSLFLLRVLTLGCRRIYPIYCFRIMKISSSN